MSSILKGLNEGRNYGRDSWDSNMPGYQGDYGGAKNFGRRNREWDEDDRIDARIRAEYEKKKEYEQNGTFWLKLKDSQRHLPAGPFKGKQAANTAAIELLSQQPELKGNLVITAYGPDEGTALKEESPIDIKIQNALWQAVTNESLSEEYINEIDPGMITNIMAVFPTISKVIVTNAINKAKKEATETSNMISTMKKYRDSQPVTPEEKEQMMSQFKDLITYGAMAVGSVMAGMPAGPGIAIAGVYKKEIMELIKTKGPEVLINLLQTKGKLDVIKILYHKLLAKNALQFYHPAPQGVAESQLDELSPATLASYKKKAGADATQADKRGDYARGNKRMSGIMQATRKEFDNDSKNVKEGEELDENLHKWFKEKWVRFGPDGKIRGDCARGDDSEGKPKCLPQSKAQNLGKKGRASAAARKRREDPNPERSGKAINVNTKKKSNEGVAEGLEGKVVFFGTGANGGKYEIIRHGDDFMIRANGKHIDSYGSLQRAMGVLKNEVPGLKQGVAEEQLDELSCWSGYHRVAGTKAGFPGSCAKNKTNEELDIEEDRENFNGINLLLQKDDEEVFVKASAGSRELGHVLFVMDGDYLMPQDLEVEEKYRGQGIAQTMYDFVKSKGYKIRRSGQQTDAGAGFWAKHRPEQNVWEEQHSESCPHCGGEMVSEELMNEKKDACYYKVKSRYKVWPSAYASGALVKCRKSGADSWGNGGKKNESIEEGWQDEAQELEDWSKEVNKKLYRAHETQRPGLARQLSKLEQKHFGSSLNQGSLTEIVKAALMALQKGQMVHYDPQRVGQMPFGNIVGDDAKIIAQYNITRDELAGYRMLHDKNIVDSLEQFLKLRRLVRAKSWPLDYYEELEKLTPEEAWLKMADDLNWSKDDMNEEVQAKTDDKLLAYYAQRKAEKEKKKKEQSQPQDQLDEKWTKKYKDSINCSNPKGFSQKAHCAGKQKNESAIMKGLKK